MSTRRQRIVRWFSLLGGIILAYVACDASAKEVGRYEDDSYSTILYDDKGDCLSGTEALIIVGKKTRIWGCWAADDDTIYFHWDTKATGKAPKASFRFPPA